MSVEVAGKVKILHIIHGFGAGGVETWLLACVKYLNEHPELNIQFDFLLTGGLPGLFDQEIRNYGSELFYVRYSLRSVPSFRRTFRRILRQNKYHAVHNHQDFISGWHFLLGGKYLPARRVTHLHNSYKFVEQYIDSPVRWISFQVGRKLMSRWTTKITATSDAVMDSYGYDHGLFKKKRTYPAYCGIDTTKFTFDQSAKDKLCSELNWDSMKRIAVFVGRIGLQNHSTGENEKNPAFAFTIARELVASYAGWNFLFVGYKGETGSRMEIEVDNMQLADRIRFLDVRRDIPMIMSASDVFLFPSLREGLGLVAVEAQCSGLNVVMSDTIPAESIVCPELVTVKSLNEKPVVWVKAITDSSEAIDRKKYSEKIKQSNFSIENSVTRMLALYEC